MLKDGLSDWEVMIASSDLESRRKLAQILEFWGLEPICSPSVGEAREVLSRGVVRLVFCEDSLHDGNFRDLLDAANSSTNRVRVIVILRNGEGSLGDTRQEALQMGAFGVISPSFQSTDVEWSVIEALRDAQRQGELPLYAGSAAKGSPV
jgi:DNA-binding NtrC family response regulator